ncbi:MAG: histidine kinase [Solirubrobacterales bacterium]|jgi:signal transduction histidine kinase|nr:histidine kinase [Solirubrobacterales bacterium]
MAVVCLLGEAGAGQVEYVRFVSRPRFFARRHALDVLIVFGAVESALEVVFRNDAVQEPRTPHWFAAVAVAVVVGSLLGRRRFPVAAPVSLWLLAPALSFVDGRLVVFTVGVYAAGMAAALLLGNLADPRQSRIGLVAVLGGSTIIVLNDPDHQAGEFLFVPVVFAIAWAAGYVLRQRSGQAEAAEDRAIRAEGEREENARHAVFEERVRIARELHDVVAHHVSMMGVQAGAARVVIDRDPGKAKEALSAIEGSSRQAVAELHRLLGFLRQVGDRDDLAPQPGLSRLPQLATSMRDSDLTVQIDVEGDARELPPTVDVSAYRIVQEALTNTLKHSVASRADVHLRYWPDELEVEIVDDGHPNGAATEAWSGGLGLIGMRERAALHGGELSAGPGVHGGFVVRARLPAGAP